MSADEIWREGSRVATIRERTLYGRADVIASTIIEQNLSVEAEAIDGNANHANAIGWPEDKHQQKLKAIKIATASKYVKAVD